MAFLSRDISRVEINPPPLVHSAIRTLEEELQRRVCSDYLKKNQGDCQIDPNELDEKMPEVLAKIPTDQLFLYDRQLACAQTLNGRICYITTLSVFPPRAYSLSALDCLLQTVKDIFFESRIKFISQNPSRRLCIESYKATRQRPNIMPIATRTRSKSRRPRQVRVQDDLKTSVSCNTEQVLGSIARRTRSKSRRPRQVRVQDDLKTSVSCNTEQVLGSIARRARSKSHRPRTVRVQNYLKTSVSWNAEQVLVPTRTGRIDIRFSKWRATETGFYVIPPEA